MKWTRRYAFRPITNELTNRVSNSYFIANIAKWPAFYTTYNYEIVKKNARFRRNLCTWKYVRYNREFYVNSLFGRPVFGFKKKAYD